MKTLLTIALLLLASVAWGADQADWPNIYIDADAGGSGVGSQADPYKSADEINKTTGGDNSVYDAVHTAGVSPHIKYQCGDTFSKECIMWLPGGLATVPVYIESYGSGAKPKLNYSYTWNSNWTQYGATDAWYTDWGTPATTGSNLITNGTFEVDSANWSLYTGAPAVATGVRANNDAHDGAWSFETNVVTTGTDDEHIIIKSPTFAQTRAKQYRLAFWAKAGGALSLAAPQSAGKINPGVNNGLKLFTNFDVNAVGWQQYVYYWEATYTHDNTWCMVRWPLGDTFSDGDVLYIDDIEVHELTDTGSCLTDIGNIVFDNGNSYGHKKDSLAGVTGGSQGDFFVDLATYVVYIYSASNPGTYYSNIEIAGSRVLLRIEGESNIIIDGLHFCNTGFNGIFTDNDGYWNSDTTVENITIKNCWFTDIGGKWLQTGVTAREGNGTTYWNDIDNIVTEYCYAKECYDAAFTNQGTSGDAKNVHYRFNIIELCEIGIEMWFRGTSFADLYVYNNTVVNTGYQSSYDDRPDGSMARALKLGYMGGVPPTIANANVKNNIMYRCRGAGDRFLFKVSSAWTTANTVIENNLFYQEDGAYGAVEDGVDDYDYDHVLGSGVGYWDYDSGWGANCIASDPLMYNPTSGDFRLLPASPCKDAGTDVSITTDYDGNSVPLGSAPDIGAKEFVPGNVGITGTGVTFQ